MIVKKDESGKRWIVGEDGSKRKLRWYHEVINNANEWLRGSRWNRDGHRGHFYGGNTKTYENFHVEAEIDPMGHICSVWFRRHPLPFKTVKVNQSRADAMRLMYFELGEFKLFGVEVDDGY